MCRKQQCVGCNLPGDQPWLAPCDDNATASSGAQTLTMAIDQLPRAWLAGASEAAGAGLGGTQEDRGAAELECEVYDIFDTPHKGKSLGRMAKFSAVVPPHGVRFLLLSDCS